MSVTALAPEPVLLPPADDGLMTRLLRDPAGLRREITSAAPSHELISGLLRLVAASAAIYGLAIGLQGGLLQALSSAVKLPIVVIAAAGFALPLLYLTSRLSGLRLSMSQISALVLHALASATITMACLAPLVAICWLTLMTTHTHAHASGDVCDYLWWVYRRVTLAGVGVAAIGGVLGAARLLRAVPLSAGLVWGGGFALAALQLSWLLRPIVGTPITDGALLRPIEGSGIDALLLALHAVL